MASNPTLGVTLVEGGAEFAVWAPHCNKVWVFVKAGAVNADGASPERVAGEQFEMQCVPSKKGVWHIHVPGVKERDEYYFILDSNHNDMFKVEGALLHRRDPYARETDFGSNTCYVTDPAAFKWSPWKTPPFEDLVLYEVHAGTYVGLNDGGDETAETIFQQVTSKLDFIRDQLGFNAIQFMPLHEFSGEWGYNPRLLLAIHNKFGTAAQLRELVDEAHQRGIAIIWDVVLNHGASKMNSLWAYDGQNRGNDGGIYFEGGGDTPWGKKFSFGKPEVREMLLASARMFLKEYNGDGLRFDSVHNNPWDVLQYLTYNLRKEFPDKILIAEIVPENPKVITGAGFDSTWIHSSYFDTLKIIRGGAGGDHYGMVKAMIGMHRGFTKPPQCIKYMLGCHDSVGDKKNGGMDGGIHRYSVQLFGGRGNWHARAQCRMLWALNMTVPCIPMLFMGMEIHQGDWWNVDHHHRYNWAFTKDDIGVGMMRLVKDLNTLRAEVVALRKDSGPPSFTHEDGRSGITAFKRCAEGTVVVVVINPSEGQWDNSSYGMHVAEAGGTVLEEVFNSQSKQYGGWDGSGNAGKPLSVGGDGRIHINLPKWSVLAFRKK